MSDLILHENRKKFNPFILNRFLFMIEMLFGLIIYFILYYFCFIELQTLTIDPNLFLVLEYSISALIAIFSFSLNYFIVNALFHKDQSQEPFNIFIAFKITRQNLRQQIIITFFLICVIYIPLDLLGYFIPGMLTYSANAAMLGSTNFLTISNTFQFFLLVFLLYFAVAIREEFYFRNFTIAQGERVIPAATVIIYSAVCFALEDFAYTFSPIGSSYPIYFPIIWSLMALYIGLIAGYVYLRNRIIWPLILGNLVNNVVSAIVLRNFLAGKPFYLSIIFPYFPFLILGVILLIIYCKKWTEYLQDFGALSKVINQ